MDVFDPDFSWLTLKEAAEFLGVDVKAVRAWIKDDSLLALPHPTDGKLRVPSDFLVKREDYAGPLESLQGTITLLRDCGFDPAESVAWLLEPEDSLGDSPLQALKAGRKKAVRRIAAAMAL